MPKRKAEKGEIKEENETLIKKPLTEIEKITGTDKDLSIVEKELLNSTEENSENELFIDPELQYLLLDELADNLELDENINKNIEGDEIDGFKEKIRELVEKIFQELRGNTGSSDSKKSPFLKTIIIIFSILLNANISSVKKIKKIIKQRAKLVLHL